MKPLRLAIFAFLAVFLTAAIAGAQLTSDATGDNTTLNDFAPPGTLYDNDVSDMVTSLASQDSDGTFLARTADDFTIDGMGCDSGQFDLSTIRVQIVQNDAAPQAFGIELYDDDGTGTSPSPTDAIMPIASAVEVTQMNLGPFGIGTSLFEASFDATGTQLAGDTVYWISAFGTNGALNAAGFNNFFASSAGAAGTTPNGVIIAPGAGVAMWTAVDAVIGPPPLAFSFAIDGECAPLVGLPIPTIGGFGVAVMLLLLAVSALFVMRRRQTA